MPTRPSIPAYAEIVADFDFNLVNKALLIFSRYFFASNLQALRARSPFNRPSMVCSFWINFLKFSEIILPLSALKLRHEFK